MQLTREATAGGGVPQSSNLSAAFQLKGSVATLTVVRLLSPDLEEIDQQLRRSVAQQPSFFCNAPVVVDFGALGPLAREVAFERLVRLLRAHQLVPVAACHLDEAVVQRAAAAGLGAMQKGAVRALREMSRAATAQGAAQQSSNVPSPAARAPQVEAPRSPLAASRSIADAPAARGRRPLYHGDDEPTLVAMRSSGDLEEFFFRKDDNSHAAFDSRTLEAEFPGSPARELLRQSAQLDQSVRGAPEFGEDEPYSVVQVIELGQPKNTSTDEAAQAPSAAYGRLAWHRQIATALVSGAAVTAALLAAGYTLRGGSAEAIRAAMTSGEGASTATRAPVTGDEGTAIRAAVTGDEGTAIRAAVTGDEGTAIRAAATDSEGNSARVARVAASPPAAEAPAQAPAEPSRVRIVLKVIPASATVTFDGQRVGNPHRVDMPRRAGYARFAASAPGYQTRHFDVPLTKSSRWLIALHPSAAESAPVPPEPAEAAAAERPVAGWPADDFDDPLRAADSPDTSARELAAAPRLPSP